MPPIPDSYRPKHPKPAPAEQPKPVRVKCPYCHWGRKPNNVKCPACDDRGYTEVVRDDAGD